jgi:hypothetical protein
MCRGRRQGLVVDVSASLRRCQRASYKRAISDGIHVAGWRHGAIEDAHADSAGQMYKRWATSVRGAMCARRSIRVGVCAGGGVGAVLVDASEHGDNSDQNDSDSEFEDSEDDDPEDEPEDDDGGSFLFHYSQSIFPTCIHSPFIWVPKRTGYIRLFQSKSPS